MIRLTAVIEIEGQAPRALTFESTSRQVYIGRDKESDFQVPLSTVSRRHLSIIENDGVYLVEDLGSTHGSVLNGKKLLKGEKQLLRDGDILELTKARITCTVESGKIVEVEAGEGTQAIAAKAVQGILGRLGDATEGPYLRVLNGADEGARFSLTGSLSEWACGRSKDVEFVLNDPNVSRRHALFKKDWNGFLVSDLGSKNGVIVNGKKVQKVRRLVDKDEITIGPIRLVFVDPDADLMKALEDVPGFEGSQADDLDDLNGEDSQVGALGEEDAEGIEFDGEEGPEAEEPEEEAEEEIDPYENLDPELLENVKGKFPTEWLVVGIVGVLIIASVLLLFLIL